MFPPTHTHKTFVFAGNFLINLWDKQKLQRFCVWSICSSKQHFYSGHKILSVFCCHVGAGIGGCRDQYSLYISGRWYLHSVVPTDWDGAKEGAGTKSLIRHRKRKNTLKKSCVLLDFFDVNKMLTKTYFSSWILIPILLQDFMLLQQVPFLNKHQLMYFLKSSWSTRWPSFKGSLLSRLALLMEDFHQ